ncbi:SctD/MshK family protein [Bosea sp. NPDC055332]
MTTASLALRQGRELAPAGASNIGLAIEEGLHEGARLKLDSGSYRVGSASDCDIILHDDGVAGQHAVLRVIDGELRLEAVGGAIALDPERRRVLPAGSGVKPTLPATVWIGRARLKLTGRAAARRIGMRAAIMASGFVALAGIVAAYAMASLPSPAPPVMAKSNADPTVTNHAPGERVADAAAQLRRTLVTSGLSGVAVTASGERVLATGTVEPGQAQAWSAAQQAFDAAHGGRLQLGSEVRVAQQEEGPKIALQAVWLGEHPYVLTTDGGRHHQGAFLDNGWTVRSITRDGVTFVRGERKFTLTF